MAKFKCEYNGFYTQQSRPFSTLAAVWKSSCFSWVTIYGSLGVYLSVSRRKKGKIIATLAALTSIERTSVLSTEERTLCTNKRGDHVFIKFRFLRKITHVLSGWPSIQYNTCTKRKLTIKLYHFPTAVKNSLARSNNSSVSKSIKAFAQFQGVIPRSFISFFGQVSFFVSVAHIFRLFLQTHRRGKYKLSTTQFRRHKKISTGNI
jgi:nucleoside recognition membrane protein YjiH